MAVPKLRFKADDGSQFPDWEEHEIAELIQLYNEKVSSDCQLPILTSSKKNGIEYQEEHFAGKQRHDIEGYNVLPRNYCTYRNRSDRTDFTFNINKLCDKGIVSKFYPVFKEKDCDLFFLVSLLNNERKTVRKIAYTAKGTGQKVLSITDLRNITVNMPSLPEQQKIADFLSTIDTVIAKQKETVSAWEERKKGVMQKLFSQEVRFKADDGSNFPEWEKKPFGDIVSEFKVKTKVENEDTLLSCAINGVFLNSELFGHQRGQSNIGYLKIKKGTLILSAQNLHLGNANVNLRFEHGIISPAYKTYDIVGCSAEYMSQWVKWDMTKQFFYNATTVGASECRRNVDWNMLYSQLFAVPCLAEQRKIADCLSSFDEVIEKQKATLSAWEELKKGLLQQMFV